MKSYFVDTNYFLRLFLRDDLDQFAIVYGLFQKAIDHEVELHTSVIVFFEIYWVLSSFYKKNKPKCITFLQKILQMEFVQIENRETVKKTMKLFTISHLEFEDCYNIAYYQDKGIQEFATSDQKIKRLIS